MDDPAPIFHVNGDDQNRGTVARLAFSKQAFGTSWWTWSATAGAAWRGDDPSMTSEDVQIIDGKRSVRRSTPKSSSGAATSPSAAEELLRGSVPVGTGLQATRDTATTGPARPTRTIVDSPIPRGTAVDASVLARVGQAHLALPEGFVPHTRLGQVLERRATRSVEGDIDWGFAEILAFGSLVEQGVTVRLSGQDSRRGTFVQRHASIVDSATGNDYLPVKALERDGGRFFVHDSLLAEFAVMGFEYGYSVEAPDALVCWEAQFGDFANGAQSIVDEFISSGEVKWGQRSSVTLLLPHAHDGGGRTAPPTDRGYLQLCAEDNMRVAMPTTPASHFHLCAARHCRRRSRWSCSHRSPVAAPAGHSATPTSPPTLRAGPARPGPAEPGRGQAHPLLRGQGF
jgi:2-oxoglutarate dehydrogenase E1 component